MSGRAASLLRVVSSAAGRRQVLLARTQVRLQSGGSGKGHHRSSHKGTPTKPHKNAAEDKVVKNADSTTTTTAATTASTTASKAAAEEVAAGAKTVAEEVKVEAAKPSKVTPPTSSSSASSAGPGSSNAMVYLGGAAVVGGAGFFFKDDIMSAMGMSGAPEEVHAPKLIIEEEGDDEGEQGAGVGEGEEEEGEQGGSSMEEMDDKVKNVIRKIDFAEKFGDAAAAPEEVEEEKQSNASTEAQAEVQAEVEEEKAGADEVEVQHANAVVEEVHAAAAVVAESKASAAAEVVADEKVEDDVKEEKVEPVQAEVEKEEKAAEEVEKAVEEEKKVEEEEKKVEVEVKAAIQQVEVVKEEMAPATEEKEEKKPDPEEVKEAASTAPAPAPTPAPVAAVTVEEAEEKLVDAHDALIESERELTKKMIEDEKREGVSVLLLLNEQLNRQEKLFEAAAERKDAQYRATIDKVKKAERVKYERILKVEKDNIEANKELEFKEARMVYEKSAQEARRQTMSEVVINFAKESASRVRGMEVMEAKIKALERVFADRNETSMRGHLVHKLSVAILSLEEALKAKKPLREELRALKAASKDDSIIDAATAALEDIAAAEGVPTISELRHRFESVSTQGRRAALMAEGGGVFGAFVGYLLSYIPEAPEGRLPEEEGNESRFSRAQYYLEKGDVKNALNEMRSLPADSLARKVVADWAREAEKRVVFEQTVIMLKSHLTCLTAALA
mmetsp:Transcript_43294/g.112513  ORF Transcript_43294/g.112513 Transcript_43294/m.112513 type:complete len:731 (-) Transcript_43294:169-2361(-)